MNITGKADEAFLNRLKFSGKKAISAAAVCVILIWMAVPAFAPEQLNVHGNINLNGNSGDFGSGFKRGNNNSIGCQATYSWIVTVKSLDANLGQSDDLTYTKPLSDLQWQLSTGSGWTSLTTSDVTVITGGAGNNDFDVDYRFLLSWDIDRPGSYGAIIEYTLSAQ